MFVSIVVFEYLWRRWSSSLGIFTVFFVYCISNIVAYLFLWGYFFGSVELFVFFILWQVLFEHSQYVLIPFNYGGSQGFSTGGNNKVVANCVTRHIDTRTSKLQSAYEPYVVSYRMPDSGRNLRSYFQPPASAHQGYHKLDKSTLPSPMTPLYRLV